MCRAATSAPAHSATHFLRLVSDLLPVALLAPGSPSCPAQVGCTSPPPTHQEAQTSEGFCAVLASSRTPTSAADACRLPRLAQPWRSCQVHPSSLPGPHQDPPCPPGPPARPPIPRRRRPLPCRASRPPRATAPHPAEPVQALHLEARPPAQSHPQAPPPPHSPAQDRTVGRSTLSRHAAGCSRPRAPGST
jgi:hypothetical protein